MARRRQLLRGALAGAMAAVTGFARGKALVLKQARDQHADVCFVVDYEDFGGHALVVSYPGLVVLLSWGGRERSVKRRGRASERSRRLRDCPPD